MKKMKYGWLVLAILVVVMFLIIGRLGGNAENKQETPGQTYEVVRCDQPDAVKVGFQMAELYGSLRNEIVVGAGVAGDNSVVLYYTPQGWTAEKPQVELVPYQSEQYPLTVEDGQVVVWLTDKSAAQSLTACVSFND